MKAVILAGGRGSRLAPLTFAIPKALVPIHGRPIVEWLIRSLKRHGVDEIIIAAGHMAEILRSYLTSRNFGLHIHQYREARPLGTAGPLALLKDQGIHLDENEPLLLMNGDIVTDLDFRALVRAHRRADAALSVVIKELTFQLPYGVPKVDGKDRIRSIIEKPSHRYLVNAGIYALNASVVELVPRGRFFTMPDLMSVLIKRRARVLAYRTRAHWLPIDNLADFTKANSDELRWMKGGKHS